jgi:hypothetical protein
VKYEKEFVIVKGSPTATPGQYLTILNGNGYIIESVEELTIYNVRKVSSFDELKTGIGLTEDDIELANLQGDRNYIGLKRDLKLKYIRKHKKDRQP